MRTLKRFETEAQFEAWKNSPQMRTPYACLVTETGAVHYDEGSDDDYSITITIKKDGWLKIGTPKLVEKYIEEIWLNGVLISPNNNEILAHGYDSSFYYDYKHRKNKNPNLEDFVYESQVNDSAEERGGIYYNYYVNDGAVLNYKPRKFGRLPECLASKVKNFLCVKKDDIVKIVFTDVVSRPAFSRNTTYLFEHRESLPGLYSLGKMAKEVVIGNGFRGIIGSGLKLKGVKKVFVGKNVEEIDVTDNWGKYIKHRMFVHKDTNVVGENSVMGKIIYLQ